MNPVPSQTVSSMQNLFLNQGRQLYSVELIKLMKYELTTFDFIGNINFSTCIYWTIKSMLTGKVMCMIQTESC